MRQSSICDSLPLISQATFEFVLCPNAIQIPSLFRHDQFGSSRWCHRYHQVPIQTEIHKTKYGAEWKSLNALTISNTQRQ